MQPLFTGKESKGEKLKEKNFSSYEVLKFDDVAVSG